MFYQVKAGDTGEALRVTAKDAKQNPITMDAEAGDRIVFRMSPEIEGLAPDVLVPADVIDGTKGVYEHVWNGLDNAIPGLYRGEFAITYASGKVRTIPTPGYITIEVEGIARRPQPSETDSLIASLNPAP